MQTPGRLPEYIILPKSEDWLVKPDVTRAQLLRSLLPDRKVSS